MYEIDLLAQPSSGYSTWAKNMYIDGPLTYFIISEIKQQELIPIENTAVYRLNSLG